MDFKLMTMNKALSKTSYMHGLKCKKYMWLNKHMKNMMKPISVGDMARIETGIEVGKLARQQYPSGSLVPDSIVDHQERVKATFDLIDAGVETIFEATFSFNDVNVRVDILNRTNDGYEIYEVKSKAWTKKLTKNQKEIRKFIDDIAIQYYVLNGLGFNIKKTFLTCLDGEYTRDKTIEVNEIFINIPTTSEVLALQEQIPKRVKQFIETLDSVKEPELNICSECSKCAYQKYCWQDMPEFPVFSLLTMRSKEALELFNNGIKAVEDIPDDHKFKDNKIKLVRDHWKNKTELYINNDKVDEMLGKLKYPLLHLDFETFQPKVPIYENTSPGLIIPFQYSLHIEEKDNTVMHKEFLAEDPLVDPREPLICRLLEDLEGQSTVVVYSDYEARMIKNLAGEFPQYSNELLSIKDRIWDLCDIFKKRYIYF